MHFISHADGCRDLISEQAGNSEMSIIADRTEWRTDRRTLTFRPHLSHAHNFTDAPDSRPSSIDSRRTVHGKTWRCMYVVKIGPLLSKCRTMFRHLVQCCSCACPGQKMSMKSIISCVHYTKVTKQVSHPLPSSKHPRAQASFFASLSKVSVVRPRDAWVRPPSVRL